MPRDVQLILASGSPRRAELLASAGFIFEVEPADVDETIRDGEAAENYVLRVATDKTRAIARRRATPAVVLGADTAVVVGGEILGKPRDRDDAARMLALLSGRVHDVLTAVVVIGSGVERAEIARTSVSFVPLSPADIAWYVESGEPFGKAGAYGIQGRAARFIDRIDGSWSNVVGLPIAVVARLLSDR
jgi:nucleoside triphosphate pyrophosphatase